MIELVLLTGVVVAILTIVVLCGILLMRLWLLVKERRRKRFYKIWRPLLVQCVEDVPQAVPRVSRLDRLDFLYYWNYFHESLRGEAKQRLNQVARLAAHGSHGCRDAEARRRPQTAAGHRHPRAFAGALGVE